MVTIVLFGQRFATDPYLDCLPRSWYHDCPRELACDDSLQALREFWSAHVEIDSQTKLVSSVHTARGDEL